MRVNDSGYLECYLEYIDYDGEDMDWVTVFQENPESSIQNSRGSTEVMIRPSFPQWYYGHELPDQLPVSDVTAVVDEAWKVGDMVDWLKDGCYWSGTITKLLKKDMVKLQLPAPPIGEGKCYIANRKDLRPTLEWSLEKGWTVPLAQANRKSWHTARLLRHYKSESDSSGDETSSDDENGDDEKGGMQQSVCRTSNMPQEAWSLHVHQPQTAPSYQNAQKDAAVTPRRIWSSAQLPSHQTPAMAPSYQNAQMDSPVTPRII